MFEPTGQVGYRKLGREICWYIEENPDINSIYDMEQFDNTKECEDVICAIAVSEQMLIIGR